VRKSCDNEWKAYITKARGLKVVGKPNKDPAMSSDAKGIYHLEKKWKGCNKELPICLWRLLTWSHLQHLLVLKKTKLEKALQDKDMAITKKKKSRKSKKGKGLMKQNNVGATTKNSMSSEKVKVYVATLSWDETTPWSLWMANFNFEDLDKVNKMGLARVSKLMVTY